MHHLIDSFITVACTRIVWTPHADQYIITDSFPYNQSSRSNFHQMPLHLLATSSKITALIPLQGQDLFSTALDWNNFSSYNLKIPLPTQNWEAIVFIMIQNLPTGRMDLVRLTTTSFQTHSA